MRSLTVTARVILLFFPFPRVHAGGSVSPFFPLFFFKQPSLISDETDEPLASYGF